MTARKPSAAQRAVAAGHDGRCRRIKSERDSWLCVFGCPALLALQTDPEAVLVEVTPAGREAARRVR